jgi:uncharacterized protein (DUF1919 family)
VKRSVISSRIRDLKGELARLILRRRVRCSDFTVISSNCWGSRIYHELGLPYTTPFVGLFLYAPCYLRLLGSLDHYLRQDLVFKKMSRYRAANEAREAASNYYPIGVLGGDVEVHFLHYETESEALEKWRTRLGRMHRTNLFVAFTDRDLCDDSHLLEFDQLGYSHKVVFTAKRHARIRSCVWLKEYRNEPYVGVLYDDVYVCNRHFDVADWLNGGSGRISPAVRMLNRLLEVRPR